jgi:hypothetical protein
MRKLILIILLFPIYLKAENLSLLKDRPKQVEQKILDPNLTNRIYLIPGKGHYVKFPQPIKFIKPGINDYQVEFVKTSRSELLITLPKSARPTNLIVKVGQNTPINIDLIPNFKSLNAITIYTKILPYSDSYQLHSESVNAKKIIKDNEEFFLKESGGI